MRNHVHLNTTSAIAVLTALGFATPAIAQTVSPQTAPAQAESTAAPADKVDQAQLLDIVVTAQRREESLSRVGVSVTAVSAETLARQDIGDPTDLAGIVPGFQATSSYGGATIYTLRGLGFNTRNPSSTAPIGLYLDQAALPYPYMAQGVSFDLERVEVLKGPQGTLYGRNATGGLINYVTGKPTKTLQGDVTLAAGNYKTINASGFVSGPLSDSVRARFAFDSQNRGQGWQQSVTRNERIGKVHQQSLRGTLEFGNGGPFEASLTATAWWRHGDSLVPQAIFYIPTAASPFANPLALASIIANPTNNTQADWNSVINQPQRDLGILHPAPLTDSRFLGTSLNMSYEIAGGVRLISLTSYNDLHHRDVSDAAGVQTESIFQDTFGRIRSLSEELRLVGESDNFNWSVGGYFADDRATETDIGYNDQNATVAQLRFVGSVLAPTIFPGTPQYTAAQINRSFGNYEVRGLINSNVYAAFANAEYKISDLLKVSAGGRYTNDKQDYRGCVADYLGGNIAVIDTVYPILTGNFTTSYNLQPGQCYTLKTDLKEFVDGTVRQKQSQSNFAWNVTGTVTPSATTLLYASIARGYKAGVFPIIPSSVETQFAPVRQEKLTSYEGGVKLSLLNRKIQLNLDAFYYNYIDKQIYGRVPDLIFGNLARIRNVPKSRVYGIEGDVTWRIIPSLTLSAAGAYLNSKITSNFADFTELGVATNFQGRPFAYTPKYQGTATFAYDTPISDSLRFNISGTAIYQGKANADFAGLDLFRIDARTIYNGTIGFTTADGLSITAYGKNLTNKYYWTGVTSAIDTVVRYPGMPAEYGLRVGFRL